MATIKKFNCSNFNGLSIVNEADGGEVYAHAGSIILTKPNTARYDLGFFTTKKFPTAPGTTVYIQTKSNFASPEVGVGFNHMGFMEGGELTGYGDGGIHTSYSLGKYSDTIREARSWHSNTPNGVYTFQQFTSNVYPWDVPNQWWDKKFAVQEDGKLQISVRPSPDGTIGKLNPMVGPAFTILPVAGYKIGGANGWDSGTFQFQVALEIGGDEIRVNEIVITDNGIIT
jgi:hypothetical protein